LAKKLGNGLMEKLIYLLWNEAGKSEAEFNAALLGPVQRQLIEKGVQRLQLHVVDDAVAPGAKLRFETMKPMPAAMVSFWLNAAHARGAYEPVLDAVGRIAGYAVSESTVLPITESHRDGERVRGFSQIAMFKKLPGITPEGFLQIWMRDQTRVGPETQDTFYYGQNIVVRALTVGAPPFDGIVDECYPIEALTDHLVYWKAAGSEETFQAHLKREMDNVARFIDGDNVAAIITSTYRFGGWTDQPA
jgi:hypothetical protein